MNIGLLGGTFDPIHRGHLALARAARERCDLGRVLFIPANVPPHKQKQDMAAYFHRYAMVVLATMDEKEFVPSLLEAPEPIVISASAGKGRQADPPKTPANYTIDTVRRLKQTLKKSDRLFFLRYRQVASGGGPAAGMRVHRGQPSGLFARRRC
jgi:nicotinate-nucleotide adenylyltransferase